MAELLIHWLGRTNPKIPVEKDIAGNYKIGDVIVVNRDGFEWGNEELKPPSQGGIFAVVKISDASVEQVKKYTDPTKDVVVKPDSTIVVVDTRRRTWRVVLDELSPDAQLQLTNTGSYKTTWEQIKGLFENKETLVRESDANH